PQFHHAHFQHHHHHHQPPQQQQQHRGVVMIPHSQTQHYSSNSSGYGLPGGSNSVASATSNAGVMHQQNPRFPFNSMPAAVAPGPKPVENQYSDGSPSASPGAWLGIEPAKKKRGRPRKYSPDNSIGLGLSPAAGGQISSAVGHVDSSGGTPSSETPLKRNRGRPPGSGKRQLNALAGLPGVGFTPHVIMVNSGEDIISKIMAFSRQGPRTVCILSATGAVCNVALHQTAMPTSVVTYEGRFEIISLSGSVASSGSSGGQGQTGGLTVSLASSDGRVLGGGVGEILKAASSVQIIVGSFMTEPRKSKKGTAGAAPVSHLLNFDSATGASPSAGGSSDSGEDDENG
ncbi:hypothetical protein M569_16579, partial [Genlisea aurea]